MNTQPWTVERVVDPEQHGLPTWTDHYCVTRGDECLRDRRGNFRFFSTEAAAHKAAAKANAIG